MTLAVWCTPASSWAAPVPAAPDFLGVNVHTLFKFTPSTGWVPFLDQLPTGGVKIARIEANWSMAEPAASVNGAHTYLWNGGRMGANWATDAQVAALAAEHVRALPVIAGVPDWAAGNGGVAESHYGDYAAYVGALARKYGPGGTFWAKHPELPALPVTQYEILNEVNAGGPSPEVYAALLAKVHPAVTKVQPDAKVMVSFAWSDFGPYLDRLWAAGASTNVDAIAFHAYGLVARGSLELVKTLRTQLGRLGTPDLPISVTEIGQPAVYGQGASSSSIGMVADETRAAHQALVMDALARSDCGVTHMLEYAINGTETSSEPHMAGYMGIFRSADASPTETARALQRASLRWESEYAAGNARAGSIRLCTPAATTDPANLLPLALNLDEPDAEHYCVGAEVDYDGDPLESAILTLRVGARSIPVETDGYGHATMCLPYGFTDPQFDLQATVPGAAASQTVRCQSLTMRCVSIYPSPKWWSATTQAEEPAPLPEALPSIPPPAGPGSPVWTKTDATTSGTTALVIPGTATPACWWKAPLKLGQPQPYRGGPQATLRVRAAVSCNVWPHGARVLFGVSVRRANAKKMQLLKMVALTNHRGRVFTVRRTFKRGDTLIVWRATDKKTKLPRVSTTAKVPTVAPLR
jgi:hypothetical protein